MRKRSRVLVLSLLSLAVAAQVMLYNPAWLGQDFDRAVLAGPVPQTFDMEISYRFVVLIELVEDNMMSWSTISKLSSAWTSPTRPPPTSAGPERARARRTTQPRRQL